MTDMYSTQVHAVEISFNAATCSFLAAALSMTFTVYRGSCACLSRHSLRQCRPSITFVYYRAVSLHAPTTACLRATAAVVFGIKTYTRRRRVDSTCVCQRPVDQLALTTVSVCHCVTQPRLHVCLRVTEPCSGHG